MVEIEQQLACAGTQALGAHPLFKGAPQGQGQEADQDVSLHPVGLLVEDRAQPQIALGGAKRSFGLGELDVPLPQLLRVAFRVVGAQQVRAMGVLRPSGAFVALDDVQPTGTTCGVAADLHLKQALGTREAAEPAADAPLNDIDCARAPQEGDMHLFKLGEQALALLLKHAKQWGWTAANPIDGVNKITKIRNERIRFLSDDERTKLLAACKASDNEHLYPVVIFALSTGARKNEALSLTFADLDLKRGIAVLRDTKNGETRAVPVVKSLQVLLKAHMEKVEALFDKLDYTPPARWVFPRRDGMAPIDIRAAWESARDAAGLVDFRFHDIRHSTASYLAMNGASLVEIAEVLGHRTLQMVRRYAHLSESHVKELVQAVNDKVLPAEL